MAANLGYDQFADHAREAIRQAQAQAAAYQRQGRELLAEGEGKVRAGQQWGGFPAGFSILTAGGATGLWRMTEALAVRRPGFPAGRTCQHPRRSHLPPGCCADPGAPA